MGTSGLQKMCQAGDPAEILRKRAENPRIMRAAALICRNHKQERSDRPATAGHPVDQNKTHVDKPVPLRAASLLQIQFRVAY